MAKLKVSIPNGERILSTVLFIPQKPSGGSALFVHGFQSQGRTNEQYAKKLAQNGIASLVFDLGGHGKSTGNTDTLSVLDHLADLTRVYDYLLAQEEVKLDPHRIGVAGMSYGGYLACLLTASKTPKSLLLRSPPLYPEKLLVKSRNEYTDAEALRTIPSPSNPALTLLSSFAGKVVLVNSEKDTVLPPSTIQGYNDALNNGQEHILEGAAHSLDSKTQLLFTPIVLEWASSL